MIDDEFPLVKTRKERLTTLKDKVMALRNTLPKKKSNNCLVADTNGC